MTDTENTSSTDDINGLKFRGIGEKTTMPATTQHITEHLSNGYTQHLRQALHGAESTNNCLTINGEIGDAENHCKRGSDETYNSVDCGDIFFNQKKVVKDLNCSEFSNSDMKAAISSGLEDSLIAENGTRSLSPRNSECLLLMVTEDIVDDAVQLTEPLESAVSNEESHQVDAQFATEDLGCLSEPVCSRLSPEADDEILDATDSAPVSGDKDLLSSSNDELFIDVGNDDDNRSNMDCDNHTCSARESESIGDTEGTIKSNAFVESIEAKQNLMNEDADQMCESELADEADGADLHLTLEASDGGPDTEGLDSSEDALLACQDTNDSVDANEENIVVSESKSCADKATNDDEHFNAPVSCDNLLHFDEPDKILEMSVLDTNLKSDIVNQEIMHDVIIASVGDRLEFDNVVLDDISSKCDADITFKDCKLQMDGEQIAKLINPTIGDNSLLVENVSADTEQCLTSTSSSSICQQSTSILETLLVTNNNTVDIPSTMEITEDGDSDKFYVEILDDPVESTSKERSGASVNNSVDQEEVTRPLLKRTSSPSLGPKKKKVPTATLR